VTPAGRLLVLTDRHLCSRAGRELPDAVASAAQAGARTFVFREKDLARDERRALAVACSSAAAARGASLIIASDAALAAELGGLAVHVARHEPAPPTLRWGRSCHDRQEVERALREGASYVTVSPVFASLAKPGYGPPLGLDGLRELIAAARHVPVFALGGVDPATAGSCLEAGAAGVAVMSWAMGAHAQSAAPAELLSALTQPRRAAS